MTDFATLKIRVDALEAKVAGGELDDLTNSGGRAEKSMLTLSNAAKVAGAALAALGVGNLVGDVIEANRSYQSLSASLKIATGSVDAASAAYAKLQKFAEETPFGVEQSVNAFLKLKNLGLDPSIEAMRSYGNTASSMGKDMMQMIEAVADASTGEFERLKEFGIKTSVEGEKVSFTFQGITTTIGKNAAEIEGYLQNIGNVQFAGAMDEQMKTLNGQFANLEDSVSSLYVAIGEAGASGALAGSLTAASEAVIWLKDNLDTVINVATAAGSAFVAYKAALLASTAMQKIQTVAVVEYIAVVRTAYAQSGILTASHVALGGAATGAAAGIRTLTVAMLANPAIWLAGIITALVMTFKGLSDANAAAEERLHANAAAAKVLGIELSAASQAALKAAQESKGLGDSAAGSEPLIWSFHSSISGLSDRMKELAVNARTARVEMLRTTLAEAKERETAAMGLTQGGARNSFDNAGAAFRRGDVLAGFPLLWESVNSGTKDLLSAGRTSREATRDNNDAAMIAIRAKAELDKALNTPIGLGDMPKNIDNTTAAAGNLAKATEKASGALTEAEKAAKAAKEEIERLHKSSVDYLETLERQNKEFGMTEKQLRAEADARAIAAAGTDAQTVSAIKLAAAQREMNIGTKQLTDALKWQQDNIQSIEDEIALLGLVGPARDAAALELEKAGYIVKAEAAHVLDAAAAWEEYRTKKLGLIGTKSALDDEIAKARELQDGLDSIAQAANEAADSMASAFGRVGGAIGDLTAILAEYGAKQNAIRAAVAAGTIDEEQAQRDLANTQLNSMGQALGAAKGLFKEHSAGYKAMAAAEKAFAVVQMANTAINIAAGAAKMFATLGPLGFPAVAAMAAVMAGLGVAVSGGGSSYKPKTAEEIQKEQGAGSVLGDSEAKSGSISNALSLMLKNTNKDLEYSNQMVKSLRAIETGIGALTSALARQLNVSGGGFDTSGLGLGKTTTAPAWTLGMAPLLKEMPIIGGLVTGIIKALFGTTKKITLLDQGITFAESSIEDIINNGMAGQIYSDIQTQTKKKFLGLSYSNKVSTKTEYGDLSNDMERQVALIIGSLKSGVLEAAGVLGVQGAEAALNAFQVNLGKISLKDLKGDEIQQALEAVFSKLGDDMAAAALPGLEALQRVGEGVFETLARLASNYATIDTALTSIGMSFGAVGLASVEARENLIGLFGGLDEFAEQTNFFRERFLTEAEQMAPIIAAVNGEMGRLGQAGITTNDQFKALVLGLDLSSASGADMYASLMAVAPAFAKVNEYLASLHGTLVDTAEITKQRHDLEIAIAELENPELARAMRLADERALIADANLVLFDRLQGLKTEAELTALAARAAEELAARNKAVADQSRDLAIQIAELENPELARAMRLADERSLIDAANLASFDRLQALKSETAAAELATKAAEEAAAAERAIASERMGLMRQVWSLTGNTAALQSDALSQLDASNQPLQQYIWQLEAQKTAAEEATRAYEAQSSAMQEAAGRSRDFAVSLREWRQSLIMQANPAASMAMTQARWLNTAALARSGDATARGSYTKDAQAYLDAAASRATSSEEYARVLATVLGQTSGLEVKAFDEAAAFERQISLLQSTVSLTASINESVLLVDGALAELKAATLDRAVPDITSSFEAGFQSVTTELKQTRTDAAKMDAEQRVANVQMAGDLSSTKDLLQRVLFALEEGGILVGGSVTVANTNENPVPVDQVA